MNKHLNSRSAFTLLELLVASAVSIILLGVVVSVIQAIGTGQQQTMGGVQREGDLGLAADQLILDLEALSLPNKAGSEALRSLPETIEEAEGTWLMMLTSALDRDNAGGGTEDLNRHGATRAVSYRLARQDPLGAGGSRAIYAIYRAIASSSHTFTHATGTTNLHDDYWTGIDSLADPVPAPGPPTAAENFLAANVVAFSVRFQRADNGEWTSAEDAIRIGRDGAGILGGDGSLSPTGLVPGGFTQAEVSLTVLSPQGATLLESGAIQMPEAIQRFGETVVRRTSRLGGGGQ